MLYRKRRRGWRRGLYVLGLRAPTSDSGTGERRMSPHDLDILLRMAPAASLLLAGDFNAEFGNSHGASILGYETVGSLGASRLTIIGREWRPWLSRHGLVPGLLRLWRWSVSVAVRHSRSFPELLMFPQ